MTTRVYSSISIDTTLSAGGISSTATTMTVASGTGNSLMGGITLTPGDIFTIAIDPDTVYEEICYITAQSRDTFTITRHEAGTSGVVHAAGATVRHVLSSDDLTYFRVGVQTADAAIPKSTLTTKGDILGRTSTGVDRIPVGSNGYVLTADSTATLGVGWTAPVTQNISFNAQTGTTYTFVASDVNKLVTLDNTSAITVTVPANATTAFATGSQINLQQINTGQVTVQGAAGVTINGTGTKTRTQWSAATLVKSDTNTWTLIGDLA